MKNLDIILEKYRIADSEKRIYIFLQNPALRNRFIEIDQHDEEEMIEIEN